MPTYAPNHTGRYKAHYIAAGLQHTIQIRQPRGSSLSSIISTGASVCHDIFNALAAFLADDFQFTAAEAVDQDLTDFIPCTLPTAVTGTVDWVGDDWSGKKRVSALHFAGRAVGSRAGVFMYGIDINTDHGADPGGDGLVLTSELAGLSTVISTLQGNAAAVSGTYAFWQNHATVKVNDFLLKRVRRGVF